MTATNPKARSSPPTRPARRRLCLNFTMHTEASDHFRALPLKERKRIVEEFRQACAPAYASVDEYLAEKRREQARDADA